MFTSGYFPATYFPPTYFAEGEAPPPPPPDPTPPNPGGPGRYRAGDVLSVRNLMLGKLSQSEIVAAWQARITAWGATDEVRLFTNNFTPGPLTLPAEFVEPVGDWYDPATNNLAVYQELYLSNDTGNLRVSARDTQFNWASAGGAASVIIYGWWIAKADGTAVRFSGRLASPVTLGDPLASLVVKPEADVVIGF